jgi:hypothetical protein
MTRISVYSKDIDVRGNDKWIGSDAQNQNRTKNFTPDNVATYFNENQVIDLGVELRYFYDTLDPLQERVYGSITFETEIGPQVNFSAISTFILSKYTMGHTDVSQFLDFLVGSNVILSRSNNINMFGYYKIDSIEPYLPDTNFFVVTLTFEAGNGYMKEDEDYFISLVQFEQEAPATPTLQSVTDAGDTTTTTVYLNGGAVVNSISSESVVDSSYVASTNTTTNSGASIDSTGILSLSADGINFGSIAVNDITSSVQLQFPDKIAGIYTIATTDDFIVPTLQSVTDEGNTVTGTGGYKSTLDGGEFFVDNTSLNTKLRITGDGIVYFTNLAGKTTQLSNYGITGDSVNFIFPNKTSGPVYTLATTADIPVVTGFVPYTGATSNVDLGTHTLSAKDLVINHSSGSGVAASITKGGAGEALTINKTSGSGNAMSVTGGVTQLSELHLTTDLADAYIASAATWNGKFTLPALTSGSVLFSDGTTIAQDNANLFWDDTNNRLGIGTNAPTYNLDILSTGTPVFRLKRGTTTELRFSCFSGGAYIGTYNSSPLIFTTNSTDRATIFANGNFAIGTTTDAGFRLDVNGTARVSGNTTFGANAATISSGGLGTFLGGVSSPSFSLSGTANNTSGVSNSWATRNFTPTSGTGTYNGFAFTSIIDQTGGASGITRGLFINPTLTAAADWRAIEVASGITILGASTTAKASLRIPSGTAPTTPTNGDIWFDGTDLKMRIGGVTKTFTLI